jgi:CBS domain-containing protein
MMPTIKELLARKGPQVYTIDPESKVLDAVRMMSERNVGALVVAREGRLLGIITERDYLREVILKGRTSRQTLVREIMTRRVTYAEPEATAEEVLGVMTDRRFRHVPVLEGDRLAGVISIGDCVKAVMEKHKVEIRNLKEYISDKYPGPDEGSLGEQP